MMMMMMIIIIIIIIIITIIKLAWSHQALQPTKLHNRKQTSTVVCSPHTSFVQ